METLLWKYLEYVLILPNYKKLKSTKINTYTISSILSEPKEAQWLLMISKISSFWKSKFHKRKLTKACIFKTVCTETKEAHWLLIISKIYFFENSNFTKENSPKCVSLSKNYWLLYIKMHGSYFKYNDLLHTLNVYEIPAKEHQVADFWVTDEITASEILFWKY